ncbi:MAG: hypothetical protein ABSC48_10890 [Terracidiphilus sp.]|jgi:hypothetical protein
MPAAVLEAPRNSKLHAYSRISDKEMLQLRQASNGVKELFSLRGTPSSWVIEKLYILAIKDEMSNDSSPNSTI